MLINENILRKKIRKSLLKLLKEEGDVTDAQMKIFNEDPYKDIYIFEENQKIKEKVISNIESRINSTFPKLYKDEFFDTKAGQKELGDDWHMRIYQTLIDIINKNIWYGKTKNNKSPEVFYIQTGLAIIKEQFKNALVEADADYGSKTAKVVSSFQTITNISSDGAFGKEAAMAMLITFLNGGNESALNKIDGNRIINYFKDNKKTNSTRPNASNSDLSSSTENENENENENEVGVKGDEFIVDGVKFQAMPYPKAASIAEKLLADCIAKTGNKKAMDETKVGKDWLVKNIYAGLPDKFGQSSRRTPEWAANYNRQSDQTTDGENSEAHWSSYFVNVCTYDDPAYQALKPGAGYINAQGYKNYKSAFKGELDGQTTWVSFPIGTCPVDVGDQMLSTSGGTFEDLKKEYVPDRHGRIVVSVAPGQASLIGGNESGRIGDSTRQPVDLDDDNVPKPGVNHWGNEYKVVFKRVKVIGRVENKQMTESHDFKILKEFLKIYRKIS